MSPNLPASQYTRMKLRSASFRARSRCSARRASLFMQSAIAGPPKAVVAAAAPYIRAP